VNARLAIAASDILRKTGGKAARRITRAAVARGLRNVRRNSRLRARLEVVRWGGRYLLDVAHNPAGMETLASSLPRGRGRPRVAVFGVMRDKEYSAMLETLAGTVSTLVVVAPHIRRALPVGMLYREARKRGLTVRAAPDVKAGLAMARRLAGATGTVLVTGSHYVVAEALVLMQKRT